jgi:hypothetical protein
MPAPARNSVRRLNETRLVGADMGNPPRLAFFVCRRAAGQGMTDQSGDKLTA